MNITELIYQSKMPLPRYKTCCCFDARTGAQILGILGVLSAGFYFISNSVGLGVYAPQIDQMIDDYKLDLQAKFDESYKTEQEEMEFKQTMEQLDAVKTLVPWLFVLDIVGAAFEWTINAALLYGIAKAKAGFMLPWLILHMAGIVFGCFGATMGFFVVALATPGGIVSALILLLMVLPFIALPVYFWLVVRSVYLDIRESVHSQLQLQDEEFTYCEKPEKAGKYAKL